MSDTVNTNTLTGLKESGSSLRSDKAFQTLAASNADSAGASAGLRELRNILVGLKLRHEAIAEDRRKTEESAEAYKAHISDLRQQLESKSRELEALKSKYQAEEKIVRLAQESFEHPQWIDVGGEEVRMVLNRTQTDLLAEKSRLETEVSELEDEMQRENRELKRRLELTNTTLSTVSELRSKIEMPKEQREQIFGREGDHDAEQASADEERDAAVEANFYEDGDGDNENSVANDADRRVDREVEMVDADNVISETA